MWIAKYILIPILKAGILFASMLLGLVIPMMFIFNTLRLKKEIKRIKDETNW